MPTFGVITKVPNSNKDNSGNLAAVMDIYVPTGNKDNYGMDEYAPIAEVRPDMALAMLVEWRRPVFTLGEILILDDSGREVSGHGRKPDKWSVVCETFDNLEDVIAKAIEVRNW